MPLRMKVDNQLQDVALKYYKAVRWDPKVLASMTVVVKISRAGEIRHFLR